MWLLGGYDYGACFVVLCDFSVSSGNPNQPLHFVKQLMHRHRRVATCDEWDGTEGAETVAAFVESDLHNSIISFIKNNDNWIANSFIEQ